MQKSKTRSTLLCINVPFVLDFVLDTHIRTPPTAASSPSTAHPSMPISKSSRKPTRSCATFPQGAGASGGRSKRGS
jgi:hypothetical protein